ncbi:Snapin [Parasponia andersonii]|uniref:Biogenesis of lysosome-related organelles complex 1 subunit 7 n=1 Tax=Parasponia andersonii TaxID=3476 RepID=A0A2P5D1X5_PARAD|nr:Snapin [Parasponia andersonii]
MEKPSETNNCVSTEEELVGGSVNGAPNHDSNGNVESAEADDQNDALARGLSSLLSTVISEYDSKAEDTLRSQHHLSSALDRLTGELDKLLEDAPLPFIMQYAAKISTVRKRVSSLNSVLKSIQRRVDNMDRMLSLSMSHEKAAPECSEHHSYGKGLPRK